MPQFIRAVGFQKKIYHVFFLPCNFIILNLLSSGSPILAKLSFIKINLL